MKLYGSLVELTQLTFRQAAGGQVELNSASTDATGTAIFSLPETVGVNDTVVTRGVFVAGYTTTATAAATTTLTVASTYQQYFTGTTTQTVLLPVTSTLTLGWRYLFTNASTGAVTVESSGGNTVQVMAAGTFLEVTVILASGTTAASWSTRYGLLAGAGGGTVTSVALSTPSFLTVAGSPVTTTGTLAVTLATQTANTVFAGPTSGGAATPTFRTLVAADLPTATPTSQGAVTSYSPIVASSVNTTAGNYTILTTDGYSDFIIPTGGTSTTLTLPAASANAGRTLFIKKTDTGAGTLIVSRAGSDLIDGLTSWTLYSQYEWVTFTSDGSANWEIGATRNTIGNTGGGAGSATTAYPKSGFVGEYKEDIVTSSASITTSTVFDVDGGTALGLAAGIWDITGVINWIPGATTSYTILESWIGTASGTSTAGRDFNRNTVTLSVASDVNGGNNVIMALPTYRVSIGTSTNFFFKGLAIFTGTMTATGVLRATRVA